MKLLLIDDGAFGLSFVMRCQEAGHDVRVFNRTDEKSKFIGKGIWERVDSFEPWLRWADLIVLTDNTRYIQAMDNFRKVYPKAKVIAPTTRTAAWEQDRKTGDEIFKRAGIATLPTREFSSYDDAIAYVKKRDTRLVSKPNGKTSNNKALSYCAKSPEDLVYMLERWKRSHHLKDSFVLQDFMPGIEMAVGAWFGPSGFNSGFEENWEFKKYANDDMGVATGEQGTVLRFVGKSKLAQMVVEPLRPQLQAAAYLGNIDVNCIIDEKGNPWPLEFTNRLGWPAFQIAMALHEGDPAQWLLDLAEGRDAKNFRQDEIAIGVVLSIPDYPYSHATRAEVVGVPIYGLKPEMLEKLHFCEVQLGAGPAKTPSGIKPVTMYTTAGDYVMVATGTGSSVEAARKKVYGLLKEISLPSSPMYRTDIGKRLQKQLPELQKHSYAMGMTYQ